jgi:hypothetical protein
MAHRQKTELRDVIDQEKKNVLGNRWMSKEEKQAKINELKQLSNGYEK